MCKSHGTRATCSASARPPRPPPPTLPPSPPPPPPSPPPPAACPKAEWVSGCRPDALPFPGATCHLERQPQSSDD
eukprot:9488680-Pyramimonas_sp.AAC.1